MWPPEDVTPRLRARAARVVSVRELAPILARARRRGWRIAFTNGCFDLLHAGHVQYLDRVKRLADLLVVGLNSDASVRRVKGPGRPLVPARDRARVLAGLRAVDYVTMFSEETPQRVIQAIQPDLLAKGADWGAREIVGAERVRQEGGRVVRIPYLAGRSTSRLIATIVQRYGRG